MSEFSGDSKAPPIEECARTFHLEYQVGCSIVYEDFRRFRLYHRIPVVRLVGIQPIETCGSKSEDNYSQNHSTSYFSKGTLTSHRPSQVTSPQSSFEFFFVSRPSFIVLIIL